MSSESRALSWVGIIRLGLVQACLGAIVVLVTSTLNRVMVVEYGEPAVLPGMLVALHYVVQLMRPRFGYASDTGKRRTPWIIGGMGLLALGGLICAAATVRLPADRFQGLTLAIAGYGLVGLGASAAGTSLLALMAQQVDLRRRAAAATIMWILMIVGFAFASTAAGHFLDPFSAQRLVVVVACAAGIAFVIAVASVWSIEEDVHSLRSAPAEHGPDSGGGFLHALRQLGSEPETRRFTVFVFISMLAYSAQELLLEPFAGLVFGYSVGQSASLSGLQHASVVIGMICVGIACSGTRRFGSLRAWTIGGCLASAVAFLSLAAANIVGPLWPLRLSVAALGFSNGVFAVAAITSMMELAHKGQPGSAGVRMGLWGAAQAIAFALGGVAATSLVDSGRYVFGSSTTAFLIVFSAEAALFFAAARYAARVGALQDHRLPNNPIPVTV